MDALTLQDEADRICADWGVDPISVVYNNRLRTTGGRYRWERQYHTREGWVEVKQWIEIAEWAQAADHADIADTLRHELAHYFAHIYHGADCRHDPRWQEWARALGARPLPYYSNTMRQAEAMRSVCGDHDQRRVLSRDRVPERPKGAITMADTRQWLAVDQYGQITPSGRYCWQSRRPGTENGYGRRVRLRIPGVPAGRRRTAEAALVASARRSWLDEPRQYPNLMPAYTCPCCHHERRSVQYGDATDFRCAACEWEECGRWLGESVPCRLRGA